MANGTITIRTTPEIEAQITALAESMNRSRNWVIEDALKEYLAVQAWQVKGIYEAIESMDRGEGVPFEEAMDRLRANIERLMPTKS